LPAISPAAPGLGLLASKWSVLSSRPSVDPSLADLLRQPVDGRGDAVLHVSRPAEGRAAVFVEVGPALVAPFLPDPSRRDVGDHAGRIAAHPGAGAELALEAQRIIHDRLGAQADDERLPAEAPGMHRVRVRRLEPLARLELSQHARGPPGADGVRIALGGGQ